MDETSNQPLSEQYRIAALEWVDAEAAAALLEDTKSSVLSQMIQECGDIPHNRAETMVKASPQWVDHIEKIADARRKANRLKVKMEYLRMRFNEQQSHEANVRAEKRM